MADASTTDRDLRRADITAMTRAEILSSFDATLDASGLVGYGASRRGGPTVTLRATEQEIAAALAQLNGVQGAVRHGPSRNLAVIETLRTFAGATRHAVWRQGERGADGRRAPPVKTGEVAEGRDGLALIHASFGRNNLSRRVHLDKAALREALLRQEERMDVASSVANFRAALGAFVSRETSADRDRRRRAPASPSR